MASKIKLSNANGKIVTIENNDSNMSDITLQYGVGTPEGVISGGVGSIFIRTDGGAGTVLYIKETGIGNTGWIAK